MVIFNKELNYKLLLKSAFLLFWLHLNPVSDNLKRRSSDACRFK